MTMTTQDGRPDRATIQVERRLRGVRAGMARLAEHPLAGLDDEAPTGLPGVCRSTSSSSTPRSGWRGRWPTRPRSGPADVVEAAWAAGRVAHARYRVLRAGGEPVARAVHPPALRPELLRLLDSLTDDELEAAAGDILAAVSAARGDDVDGWVGYGPRADRVRVV